MVFLGFHGIGDSGPAFMALAAPGLVFGPLIGWTIGNRHYAGAAPDLGFTVASTVACFLAMYLGAALSATAGFNSSGTSLAIARNFQRLWYVGAICGLLGSGIVTAYAVKFFPYPPGRLGAASMVFAGAALGTALFPIVHGIPYFGLAFLLVGWQSGFAASLGIALRMRKVSGS